MHRNIHHRRGHGWGGYPHYYDIWRPTWWNTPVMYVDNDTQQRETPYNSHKLHMIIIIILVIAVAVLMARRY